MGITAATGPLIAFGAGFAPSDYNGQQGPSLFFQSQALLDPRPNATYVPGQADTSYVGGWLQSAKWIVLDYAPSTLSTTNIAAAYTGASPVTLVSSSGAGITVGQSISRMDNNALDTGLLAIDGASGRLSYGQIGTVQLWDPAKLGGRNVRCTSTTASTNAGLTITVNGYDVYGQPVTENIAGPAGTSTTSGKKAFKYIKSVTFTGGSATSLAIGTGDVYGFPLRSDALLFYALIFWNNAEITATTGYLAADTTSPATATTGDVRGTYAVQSASDGTKRLQIALAVSPANMASTTGLLGVTQFNSGF